VLCELSGELVGLGSSELVARTVLMGSDERMTVGLLLPEPVTKGESGHAEPLGDLVGRHDLGHGRTVDRIRQRFATRRARWELDNASGLLPSDLRFIYSERLERRAERPDVARHRELALRAKRSTSERPASVIGSSRGRFAVLGFRS
jgi:hypothetical protein